MTAARITRVYASIAPAIAIAGRGRPGVAGPGLFFSAGPSSVRLSLQPEPERDVERQNAGHEELHLGSDEPSPVAAPVADADADPRKREQPAVGGAGDGVVDAADRPQKDVGDGLVGRAEAALDADPRDIVEVAVGVGSTS